MRLSLNRAPRTCAPVKSTARMLASLRNTRVKVAPRRLTRSKRAPVRSCSRNLVMDIIVGPVPDDLLPVHLVDHPVCSCADRSQPDRTSSAYPRDPPDPPPPPRQLARTWNQIGRA